MVAALAACSGPDGSSPTDATAPAAAPRAAPTDAKAAPAPQGDCDLVTHAELSQAFGGKLTVRRSSGNGGRGGTCTYSIAEVRDSELNLQAGDAASYAARKEAYQGYRGVAMEPLPIGKEAFLVNRAQVIVLAEDGQSLNMGLLMITSGEPLPVDHAEIATALESLARTALSRM
jgi:hypothetical protein